MILNAIRGFCCSRLRRAYRAWRGITMKGAATLVFPVAANVDPGALKAFASGLPPAEFAATHSLHFASVAVVEFPPGRHRLLLELNFDGGFTALAHALDQHCPALRALVATALGMPIPNSSEFIAALESAWVPTNTFFVALPGLTVGHVTDSRARLVKTRHTLRAAAMRSMNARERVAQLAQALPALSGMSKPADWPDVRRRDRARDLGLVFATALGVLVALGSGLPVMNVAAGPSLATAFAAMLGAASLFGATLLVAIAGVLLLSAPSRGADGDAGQGTLVSRYGGRAAGCLLLVIAVVAGRAATLAGLVPALTWVWWLLLLLTATLALFVAVKSVPATDFLDAFQARLVLVSGLGLVTLALCNLAFNVVAIPGPTGPALAVAALLAPVSACAASLLVARLPLASTGSRLGALWLGLLSGHLATPLCVADYPGVRIASALLVLLLILALAGLAWTVARLQRHERGMAVCGDVEHPPEWPDSARREAVLDQEARALSTSRHNHLLSITTIKKGRARCFILRLVLFFSHMSVWLNGERGKLSGITTIHFARWVIVDGHLLFFSNYDGAWEAYLDEFIDEASTGLSAIWSNTGGFPPTRWLVAGGARDAHRFKRYARNSQHPTLFHYSAYPELTVNQIEDGIALDQILDKQRAVSAAGPKDAECELVMRALL